MLDYNKNFELALSTLNDQQRRAVENTEGTVMVVAGPGTGKTQLLAARIGYIIQNTDTSAHDILALTFTEAGAIAMRDRLRQFIGPDAYKVSIYTYHAFCNQVIQSNLDKFGKYIDLHMISDLEQADLMMKMIDALPVDNPLKVIRGDRYFYMQNLEKHFQTMKKENWTYDFIDNAINEYEQKLRTDPEYIYKKSRAGHYKKGDVKEKLIQKKLKSMVKLKEASKLFSKYNALMKEGRRYDFHDMVLWVLNAFKNDAELLSEYQERYQYILVDEYQDTNGSQNELIYKLAEYWEQPNLFVVGDDDQSIFRFQGANMDNIIDFKEKYDPLTVVLENNYRSGQIILDKASQLIKNNKERLATKYANEISKDLIESRNLIIPSKIKYVAYHNTVHEKKAIINEIIRLQKDGVNLNDIAVLYRNHRDADDIVNYLQLHNIPLNVKKKIDVLNLPIVQQLILILKYLAEEFKKPYLGEHMLFKILHYQCFGLKPIQMAKISLLIHEVNKSQNGSKALRWRDVLLDEDWLRRNNILNPKQLVASSEKIETWISDIPNLSIQVLFEKILTESGILEQVLTGPENALQLQVINSFFDFIKNEHTIDPHLDIIKLVGIIDRMIQNRIPIELTRVLHANNGVNFLTAHASKGLEFEYVYIISADEKNWVQTRKQTPFSYPNTLVASSSLSNIEDDRRLFFVAMTRAKNNLQISYALKNENEKELERVRFIEETRSENDIIESQSLPDHEIMEFKSGLMKFSKGKNQMIDKNLIDEQLQNFVLNVTDLNKYLKCPVTFYYENILRVPQARTAYIGFGNAIHKTLRKFFNDIENHPSREIPELSVMLNYFEEDLTYYRQHFTQNEFEEFKYLGVENLTAYYQEYKQSWTHAQTYMLEYKVRNVERNGIPIKGDIDKISFFQDFFTVVDYKTGSSSNKDKVKQGGEYWRQIVFYDMLVKADPKFDKPMRAGYIDYILHKDDKFVNAEIQVSAEDLTIVDEEIKQTWENIHDHKFSEGCLEDNCRWCNFVAQTQPDDDELIIDLEQLMTSQN